MKIITEDAVYVQMKDLAFLHNTDEDIPATIYEKAFMQNQVTVINSSNKEQFLKFEKPHEIKFFKRMDWILDYDEVKALTETELIILCQNICNEMHFTAGSCTRMSQTNQTSYPDLENRCVLLEYKLSCVSEFINYKQGELSIPFPKGIKQHKENGFKRLIKSLFGSNPKSSN